MQDLENRSREHHHQPRDRSHDADGMERFPPIANLFPIVRERCHRPAPHLFHQGHLKQHRNQQTGSGQNHSDRIEEKSTPLPADTS